MIKPWYDVAGVILLCSLFVFAANQFIQEVRHLQATTNRLILESKSDSTPIIFFPDKTKRKGFSVNKTQERQRVAAAKRILKCKAEFNRKYRPSDKAGAWYESGKDHGLQFIANNYCGVILTKGYFISGLPEINEEQKTIDLYKYYSNALSANHLDVTELVPDLKALREYEKIVRSQNEYYKQHGIQGVPIFIGDDLVNTKYLIDVLALLPDAKVYVHDTKMCNPILVMSPCGFGIIMPIYPLGAVNGVEEFEKNYPGINSPKNPANVFFNQTLTRE